MASQGGRGQPAPTNLRGYSLVRPLDKGGMGTVWVARKLSTHQQFAIKFLKEEFVEDATHLARFEREIAALRAIRHQNVVNVFDWSIPKEDPEAKPYVVMELLEGEGLDRFIYRQRILPPQTAVAVMLQVLDGLAAAHNIGVVHRDLGPSNVFLTPQVPGPFLVRVLDFGLARPMTGGELEAQVTQAGAVVGKPGYMAPETFLHRPADARSDIFACGMMLYRMLAGRLPFKETQAQFLWAERYAERLHDREYAAIGEHAAWVPQELAKVVSKAIRRRPEERFQTVEEMQVALLDIEDTVLARASDATPPPPSEAQPSTPTDVLESIEIMIGRPRSTKRWVAIGGGVLVAAVLVIVFLIRGSGGSGSAASRTDAFSSAPPVVATAASREAGAGANPLAVATAAADVAPRAAAAAGTPVTLAASDVAAPPPAAAAARAPQTVLVIVAGAPAGASVKVGSLVADGDPPKVRLPWSEDLVVVTVEARGYERFSKLLLPTEDRVVHVRLRPARRPGDDRRDRPAADGGAPLPRFPGEM